MGCLICKPISATSAEDLCFSLFFPTASGATSSAADTRRETSRVGDPLKPPPLQRGISRVITSPERDRQGWPMWISAVAGDALSGWAPRRADSFEKLEKVCLLLTNFEFSTRFIKFSPFPSRSCQNHINFSGVEFFSFCRINPSVFFLFFMKHQFPTFYKNLFYLNLFALLRLQLLFSMYLW
jgi:hypothetical protein